MLVSVWPGPRLTLRGAEIQWAEGLQEVPLWVQSVQTDVPQGHEGRLSLSVTDTDDSLDIINTTDINYSQNSDKIKTLQFY